MSHTLINCTCKNRLGFSSVYFDTTVYLDKRFNDFLIFSNSMAHGWSVEAGNIGSVSVFFVRVRSQISPCRAEKDSNLKYPLPRENKINQMPYPRDNKDNQIPTPCPASPPRRHYIDMCISVVLTFAGTVYPDKTTSLSNILVRPPTVGFSLHG